MYLKGNISGVGVLAGLFFNRKRQPSTSQQLNVAFCTNCASMFLVAGGFARLMMWVSYGYDTWVSDSSEPVMREAWINTFRELILSSEFRVLKGE